MRWRSHGTIHRPARGPARRLGMATLLVALGAGTAAPAAAQRPVVPDTLPIVGGAPHWAGEFAILSANALLSGVTAGIVQELRGGSFRDGFMRALPGGAAIYLGKRAAAERFDGAGLLGREVAAVGTSMVRNAGDGVPLFSSLVLPVGITRVYVTPGSSPHLRVRLDAMATGWTLYGIFNDHLHFDARRSLSAGTAVFRTRGEVLSGSAGDAVGIAQNGVLLLADVPAWGPLAMTRTFAHEREHVLQEDVIFGTWMEPLQRRFLPRLPGGTFVDGYLDLNLSTNLLDQLAGLIPQHDVRPWELEAEYLARRR